MAAFHGKAGSVTWAGGGTVSQITSWSCDVSCDIAEQTDMGDTWKTYLAGFKDWTATVECYMLTTGLDALAAGLGATAQLNLTLVSGAYNLEGEAICTNISASQSADGIPTVTYSFQGSDADGLTNEAT